MGRDTIWDLREHTRAKHLLLRNYLNAWFPILTIRGQVSQVVFMDGFAGPGVYQGGEPGSPIIALKTLVDHHTFHQLATTEFRFIFIEKSKARFDSLQREVESFWNTRYGGKPANVAIDWHNKSFVDVASEVIEARSDQYTPTFAFIDPFGFSGVPMSTIRDLLSAEGCEVLFNFMIQDVNRFVTSSNLGTARQFAELFGTNPKNLRQFQDLSGKDRTDRLRDFYKDQLRTQCDFFHVSSFGVKNVDRGRLAYYLMFGTRHYRGVEVMKSAMWTVAPYTGTHFEGFAGEEPVLFELAPDLGRLRRDILRKFDGTDTYSEAIKRFVLLETDYKYSHCTEVLKELEKENVIECLSGRQKGLSYPDGSLLRICQANRRPPTPPPPVQKSMF